MHFSFPVTVGLKQPQFIGVMSCKHGECRLQVTEVLWLKLKCGCLIDWKRLPKELRAPIKRPSRDGEYCCTVWHLINQSTSWLLFDDIGSVEVTLVPGGCPCSDPSAVPPQEEEICCRERGSASQTGGENISTLKPKGRERSSVMSSW